MTKSGIAGAFGAALVALSPVNASADPCYGGQAECIDGYVQSYRYSTPHGDIYRGQMYKQQPEGYHLQDRYKTLPNGSGWSHRNYQGGGWRCGGRACDKPYFGPGS